MKHANLLALAIAIAVNIAALGTLPAQEDPSGAAAQTAPTVSTSTISGTLVASTDSSLVVRSDAGVESTYTVDSSTVLPASLTPGDRVSVDYHMLDGGAYHASRVTNLAGSGSTAPAPASASGTDPSGSSAELPRTASPLPLFAVMGVLAIGAALGVRAIFRRMRPSV